MKCGDGLKNININLQTHKKKGWKLETSIVAHFWRNLYKGLRNTLYIKDI